MNTCTLLTGLSLALAPGAALASSAGDECAAACATPASEATCCMTGIAGVAEAPVALASTGAVCERGMLGVYLADTEGAAIVEGLVDGGPAAKAGLEVGDRIVAWGDKKVKSWNQLGEWVGSRQAGEQVSITVERDGWSKIVQLTLAPAPAPPANAAAAPSMGYFFDVEEGPMTLQHGGHGEHGEHPAHGFSFLQGGGGPVVLGKGDGGQWLTKIQPSDTQTIERSDLSFGIQSGKGKDKGDTDKGGKDKGDKGKDAGKGKAKVVIKGMKDGQVFELEDIDIDLSDLRMDLSQLHHDLDLSELHESLSGLKGLKGLKGLHVIAPQRADSGECCEDGDDDCCEGNDECCEDDDDDHDGHANIFRVFGDGRAEGIWVGKEAGKPKQGAAKGVIIQRLGGAEGGGGHGMLFTDSDSTPQGLRWRAAPPDAPRRMAPMGFPLRVAPMEAQRRDGENLEALRQELQSLRDELRELRQSLRRIQGAQRG